MNIYEKKTRETRKQISRLTAQQQQEIYDLYEGAIEGLVQKTRNSGDKSLTKGWALSYKKELKVVQRNLRVSINEQVRGSVTKAARIAVAAQEEMLLEMLNNARITTAITFDAFFSKVHENIIRDIVGGELYKDKRTLSNRIWSHSKSFEKDIQYTINEALLQKKSAKELAKDLETYIKSPAERSSEWGDAYPRLRNKKVEYQTMRLARTSINHAYQNATIQSSSMNPFVEGILWQSALQHGRTCELCIERHDQVFAIDDVPLDHPNGLCAMIPHITNSIDEVASELNRWAYGKETNKKLDDWYEEYGEYFINKL